MTKIGKGSLRAIAISGALLGAGILGFSMWGGLHFSKPNSIEELEELPVGTAVHLEGKVTYADVPGMRFWIQDQTGAIVIPQSPSNAGVHVGNTVRSEEHTSELQSPMYL